MLAVQQGRVGNLTVGHMMQNYMTESELFTEERDGNMFVEGIFMQGNVLNNNKRVYPTEILNNSIDEYVKTRVANKTAWGELGHPDCCIFLSDNDLQQFYILSSDGWKSFIDIKKHNKVLTYNTNNEILEYKNILEKVERHYKGHAYHIKGRNIDLRVTPTHRFLCKDKYGKIKYVTIEEVYQNRIIGGKKYEKYKILKSDGIWIGKDFENIVIPGVDIESHNLCKNDIEHDLNIPTDIFVKFLGIWLAEGCVCKTQKYKISISQKFGKTCDMIRDLLDKFPIEWNEYKNEDKEKSIFEISDARLWNYLIKLGDCYTKYIPYSIKQLSPQYLEELIYWFNLGDGRFDESSGYMRRNIFSVSKRLIEDLHECLIKSGGSGNWQEIICEEDYAFADHIIKAENKKPLYQLTLSTTSGIYLDQRFLKIEKFDHDGNIYCLHVEDNSNFYMMFKGKSYWTGNSPKINLDKAAILVDSLLGKGDDYYGRAKVCHEDCPCGKILRGLIKTGGKVGVSSRGLGTANKGQWQEEECNMVETFVLRAIDVVADPSAPDAMVQAIKEEKTYILDDSNGDVIELNEESYKMFENQLSILPIRQDDRNKKVFMSIKNFLNSLKSNTK